ncbi:hypothetical protein ACFQZ4_25845 [Catellatospora coxensis]
MKTDLGKMASGHDGARSRHGKAGVRHGNGGAQHTKAGARHGKAGVPHGKAKDHQIGRKAAMRSGHGGKVESRHGQGAPRTADRAAFGGRRP